MQGISNGLRNHRSQEKEKELRIRKSDCFPSSSSDSILGVTLLDPALEEQRAAFHGSDGCCSTGLSGLAAGLRRYPWLRMLRTVTVSKAYVESKREET